MAMKTEKTRCITCDKEKRAVRCEGCLQLFCYEHFTDHRQLLSHQLDHIEASRDLFRQAFNEQTKHPQVTHPQTHLLMKQIDQWEEESIKTIQQTASECRQLLIQHTTKNVLQTEITLSNLTEEIRKTRKENDFNEVDLKKFEEQLKQLAVEIDKSSHVSIQQNSTALVNKISVVVAARKLISTMNIHNNTKWKQHGSTVAGGNGDGNQINQLSRPYGICVDDEDQSIYIADQWSHRIVKWKAGAKHGHVVAGGNGEGNRLDQLNHPTDVILDKTNDSLIICDWGNRRVVRWSRRNDANQQIVIPNIDCFRITMDSFGDLYVSDWKKNEVKRWRLGDTSGTVVAGGNGKGNHLNQLNGPTCIFIDEEHSLYVSDHHNHRIMKWTKGAKEGIAVAGGQSQGNSPSQLSYPQGIIVDHLGNIYVADSGNDRIMRWLKGSRIGTAIIRGTGQGEKGNQFNGLGGLAFDRHGNLYVVNMWNHRVQKFDIDYN